MINLAIDTCDRNGSVALRIDGRCVGLRLHEEQEYSSWLLPAVEELLAESAEVYSDLELLSVANGPGSFTGVRVGLCAVKAWSEVYRLPVVGVSRLEAMARQSPAAEWVAATYDAHRGQVFAGLYRRTGGELELVEAEMVIAPEEFLSWVKVRANGEKVQWLSLDPELFTGLSSWKELEATGASLTKSEAGLANLIGELGERKAARGEFTEVLQLDANYVRRSDAEIYWKGPAHRVG